MKKWYNVELEKSNAEKLRKFLKEEGFKYEPSEVDDFIHFEVYIDEKDIDTVNSFLDKIDDLSCDDVSYEV